MDEQNKESSQEDVKKPEEEQGDESSESQKTTPSASEGVKDAGDNTAEVVEELLADGTSAKKEVRIPYDKYREKDEKSKLFDQFTPLLAKLKESPKVVDELLRNKPLEPWQERVERIEEELRLSKQAEMKSALSDALKVWPNLKEQWSELRPLVDTLSQKGVPYREALRRSYIAVNPESAAEADKLAGQEAVSQMGVFSSPASGKRVTLLQAKRYQMTLEDEEFAKKFGIDPSLYEKYAAEIEKFK